MALSVVRAELGCNYIEFEWKQFNVAFYTYSATFPYSPTEGVGDTASCINQSLPCKNGKRSSFICATLITVLLGI